jgi:hypothetical protein
MSAKGHKRTSALQ